MKQDDVKTNLLNADAWIRVLCMIVLGFLAWLTLLGLGLLVLAQVVITLVAGNPNRNLQKTGYILTVYLNQVISFLQYNSDQKPFPFSSEFPSAEGFAPPPRKEPPAPEPAPAAPEAAYSAPEPPPAAEETVSGAAAEPVSGHQQQDDAGFDDDTRDATTDASTIEIIDPEDDQDKQGPHNP